MDNPVKGRPARGKYSIWNDTAMSSQISLFQEVQSAFLGLDGIASYDELLELEALYRQYVQSPPFKEARNTRGWKSARLLSYNAWKKVVDEGITPGAAKIIHTNRVQVLKIRYGSKVDERGRSKNWSGKLIANSCTEMSLTKKPTSSRSSECTSKTSLPDLADTTEMHPTPKDTTWTSNLATLTSPQQSAAKSGTPTMATSKQTSVTDKIFITDRKRSAEALGIFYDGTSFRCIVCDLRLENSCCHDAHKPRCRVQYEAELVDGIFRCPYCSYTKSCLSPSQKMEKLIAKIAKDRDGSTANSTNPTKEPINGYAAEAAINSFVDSAAESVIRTGKPVGESLNVDTSYEEGSNMNNDEVEFTMANRPVYFDRYEWVWRCRSCDWEIEADEDYIFGSCRNGHRVELHRVKGYFPAYDDSDDSDESGEEDEGDEGDEEDEEDEEGMEWDSSDLSEADD